MEIVPERAYKPQEFLNFLVLEKEIKNIYLIGSGIKIYFQKIMNVLGERAILSRRSLFVAHEVGILGWSILKEGKGLSPDKVEPIYYRPSQAEEKWSSIKNQKKNL